MCENAEKYTSCIKLKGVPIIPPLITPQLREECQRFKQKAIEIERKRQRDKLFAKCMGDLENVRVPEPAFCSLENQLVFGDQRGTVASSTPTNDFHHVPYEQFKKLQNLRSETIDVTQYNNEGVKLITSSPQKQSSGAPPKLIRSNSYTLDSPSPILLAHLQREAERKKSCSSSDCESNNSICSVQEQKLAVPVQNFLIETDVTVQQISISAPMTIVNTKNETQDKEKSKDNFIVDEQLEELLKGLPNDCSSKILEILGKQRLDQLNNAVAHEQLKTKALENSLQNLIEDISPNGLSISSSQTLYYSLSPSTTVTQVENGCRRMLFSDVELEKEWAAHVIGAAAKGYLVRRLIKTERVQALIETIKDALVCAIQLHSAKVIDVSDVELHRRLIQQVSAACYAFHDIFFTLSIKEQMAIIAADRQRRLQKAKRPLSSNSSQISLVTPRSAGAVK